jgi:hypothetical protein
MEGSQLRAFMSLFAAAALAASAPAEPITITKGGSGGPPPAPPTSIGFQIGRTSPFATVGLVINNVTLADSGRVWTIRQDNAADFGLDWLA